jgi:hypothetical protein
MAVVGVVVFKNLDGALIGWAGNQVRWSRDEMRQRRQTRVCQQKEERKGKKRFAVRSVM